jgi:hypothetical protein
LKKKNEEVCRLRNHNKKLQDEVKILKDKNNYQYKEEIRILDGESTKRLEEEI